MRFGHRLQIAAAGLMIAAYAGLLHYCNSMAGEDPVLAEPLGTLLALSPTLLCALLLIGRSLPPLPAFLSTVSLSGLIVALWPMLRHHFSLLSLAEETALYGLLGLTFALSLRRNGTAVCTRFADRVHGPLTANEVAYTRHVTAAWALFFFTVDLVSLVLYMHAPIRIWSIFINFCVLPLVAAMFVAEFLVRGWVLPQGRRAGLLAALRVYGDRQ
jgi:uncharacterized membrane protein